MKLVWAYSHNNGDTEWKERDIRDWLTTLERFGPDGSYEGRYAYDRDGWDAFGPDGAYQGRISGEGERGAGRGEIDR